MNDKQDELDVPLAWKELDLEAIHGVVLIIGGTDTGKTTFSRYLFDALNGLGRQVALLDGDPGQSWLGPPTTMTLISNLASGTDFRETNHTSRYFVGSTTPQGHMLPVIVGGASLVRSALDDGVRTVIYDTTGLVDPRVGGLALKMAKIDLLRPRTVFAIQRDGELEPLLTPLRRSQRVQVIEFHSLPGIKRRDATERRNHRIRQYRRYFGDARSLTVDWRHLAVFPLPVFRIHRLVAFEDKVGLLVGLGIVVDIDRPQRQVTILTPLENLQGVDALHLGDILLDPNSFDDEKLRI
jgi:polynucleotide 5'-hydroxyl-kinase GRC3/NOL9